MQPDRLSRGLDAGNPGEGPIALVYWGKRGGGSLTALALAERIRARLGEENVALFLRDINEDLGAFRTAGFEPNIAALPGFSRTILSGPLALAVLDRQARSIAARRPRIVIFAMNFPFAWPLVHLLRARGLKVAYVVHDAAPHPGDYARLYQKITQDLLLRFADGLITLSDYVARELAERSPRLGAKTVVLPLESLLTPVEFRERRPPPAGGVRLLFIGRLMRYKGLDVLAQALASLRERPGWTLTIAGSGPLEAEVARSFEGWSQVRLMLGWLDRSVFQELLIDHDLLICPYVEASQSGVVAEGLLHGLPALVMPAGALPAQIGGGRAGFVVGGTSAIDLRRTIEQALDLPELVASKSRGVVTLLEERRSHTIENLLLELERRMA